MPRLSVVDRNRKVLRRAERVSVAAHPDSDGPMP